MTFPSRCFRGLMATLLLGVTSAWACGQQLNAADLTDGATFAIQLEQSVRADRAKPGDEVRAKLVAPFLMRGAVAIPAGARILGVVIEAEPLSPGRPSRISLRFHRAQWRGGALALNAYVTRQLVVKRTYTYESKSFCPSVERFLPQQSQSVPQQQPTQQPQKPPPPPPPLNPPPPSPPPRISQPEYNDACHHPTGVRRDDPRQLTFVSPAISGVSLRKLDAPAGATVLESVMKNISLGKGMMLEIRHVAP